MLDKKAEELDNIFFDTSKSDLALELAKLQRRCIEADIPVMIIVDGWESSGKGYVINELVKELDTKFYRVSVFDRDLIEDDYSYIRNLWKNIPPYGNYRILYRSIYTSLFNDLKSKDKHLEKRFDLIKNLEKLFVDDGGIILKYFLDIDKDTLEENIKYLQGDKYKSFFITEDDKNQLKDYQEYRLKMSQVLRQTNFDFANWHIVPSKNRKEAAKYIIGRSNEIISKKIGEIKEYKLQAKKFKFKQKKPAKSIEDLDLTSKIDKADYDLIIEDLQDKASDLAYKLYTENIPTVIVFEGIDAAGKGGSIARLLRKIDPRIYNVNPTSAPSDLEKKHHYLWRFYNNLPEKGNMAIFDRSWYGRVMVERVEGFANQLEWSRSYDEINKMEEDLVNNGVLLLKFHLVISKDEQARRFKDRQEDKPYKITDEDWRNRDKWDQYVQAMDDMIQYTSTRFAPWKVISSEDKRFARIEVLKEFIKVAEERLK